MFFFQALSDTSSFRSIWLLFLDTNTSLEQFFTDINIPFNCQFLVAQPHSDHVVVLTEVYRVSPTLPLQTYRFGNWTAGGGLIWPSEGLYRRRNNLKRLTIHGTHLNVRGNLLFVWNATFVSVKQNNTFRSPRWNGYKAACSILQEWQENLQLKCCLFCAGISVRIFNGFIYKSEHLNFSSQ